MDTSPGEYSTRAVSIAKLTVAFVTPGDLLKLFSIRFAHLCAGHTFQFKLSNFLSRTVPQFLNCLFQNVSINSCWIIRYTSFSRAKFTLAESTPSIYLILFNSIGTRRTSHPSDL